MKKSNYIFILLLILLVFFAILIIVVNSTLKTKDTMKKGTAPVEAVAALTFDDGPNDSYTLEVLDILKENECFATFFINGMNIPGNEDVIKRIVEEGHELANHTYDHIDLTELSSEEIKRQIDGTQEEVNKVLGDYPLRYVRPPYGRYHEEVLAAIDYPIALWSMDSGDWDSNDSDEIYQYVTNHIKDGDVIVMHDKTSSTVVAVRKIITELKEKGYRFVTLSELYKYRNETLKAHLIYR